MYSINGEFNVTYFYVPDFVSKYIALIARNTSIDKHPYPGYGSVSSNITYGKFQDISCNYNPPA